MLFTAKFKEEIRAGRITATYRSWKRPQAKVGGRYNLHPDGVIEVTGIRRIDPATIRDREARAAGFESADALRDFLGTTDDVYAVVFAYQGSGRVRQPTTESAADAELDTLLGKLKAMDRRAKAPWTAQVLETIAHRPGVRAGDLAPAFHWETQRFKAQVRKLKAHGLTISLETGYRLSERGEQLRQRLKETDEQ
ncbi:MAG: ASCH domain-containing protein [Pseudomonadota bacterium]